MNTIPTTTAFDDADVIEYITDAPMYPWNADKWNDADIYGEESQEFDALMLTTIKMVVGTIGKGRKFDTPDNGWKAKEIAWSGLGENFLTKHPVSPTKAGECYVFGVSASGSRKKEAMRKMCAVSLDLDTNCDLDETVDKVLASGYAAFLYTTHSHLTTRLELDYSKVLHIADGDITDEDAREYLRANKPDLGEAFIAQVVVAEEKHDKGEKVVVLCSTPPQHKIRVIVLLAETVNVLDLDRDPKRAPAVWGAKIAGLAEMLGVKHDPACVDPSRLFYTGRHPAGAEDWHCAVFRGTPIRFEDIPMGGDNPFSRAGGNSGGGGSGGSTIPDVTVTTPDGDVNVTDLYRAYGKRWMLADILSGTADFHHDGDIDGKAIVRCPYQHEHSNLDDDEATFVLNADAAFNGFAVAYCAHSCKDRYHTVNYIAQWLASGVLTVGMLEDPDFMMPMPKEGEEAFYRLTPTESLGSDEAREYFRVNGIDADPELMVQRVVEMGGDDGHARERVAEGLATVKRQLAGWEADKASDPVATAKAAIADEAPGPTLLGHLYDPDWVDDEWFLLYAKDAPNVYRRHGIGSNDKNADAVAKKIIRHQIEEKMDGHFDWVVVDGQAKIVIKQGRGKAPNMWKETTLEKLYRNRWVKYFGDKGALKAIKPHEVFADARGRATYVGTCFEPDETKVGAMAYNLWTGFAVAPVQGDWSLLKGHIKTIICNGNSDHFNFVMTFLASTFARPGVKVPCSLAIIGEQGTGKSKVFDWIRYAIGDAALKVSSGRHLTGNFNAHLDGKLFLTCEEAFWAGDKSAAGALKDIISSDTLQIEGKFETVVERPNYLNTTFISNNAWVVPADGEDARRFFVTRVSNARKQDARYFGAIDDQMEKGGCAAMVYELMHWDPKDVGLTWNSLRTPPATDELREQIGMSLEGPAAILLGMVKSGAVSGRMADGTTFHYPLSDTKETIVSEPHLKRLLNPDSNRGNVGKAANAAIDDLLGEGARSDNKTEVLYYVNATETTPETTNDRTRYITFPALDALKDTVKRYGG